MATLIVATRNRHKLRELGEALPGIELEPLPDGVELPPEVGLTFAENALAKARAAHVATGVAVIADDSGIQAAALDGAPGVFSARYAGDGATDGQNLAKLIEALAGAEDRRVAYICALALIEGGGSERLFEGVCEGTLTEHPQGTGGFGYDPAFVPDGTPAGDTRTMAELSSTEKHAISHRGRAARDLAEYLGMGAQP